VFYNRRTISKTKQLKAKPFNEQGKLNKGFRYTGDGKVTDSQGNQYLISDYK
jgi:hypothetical protein